MYGGPWIDLFTRPVFQTHTGPRAHISKFVTAILIVLAVFHWGWQMEVQPEPSGLHSNAGFRATLKHSRLITMLLLGLCAEAGVISPATEAVEPV